MKLPLVPMAAVTLGGISAFAAAAVPAGAFDHPMAGADWAWWGLHPLSGYARVLAVIAIGAIGAGSGLLAAQLLRVRARGTILGAELDPLAVPIIRRADAHPDALSHSPLRATYDLDLPAWAVAGPPTSEANPIAERDLPADLDQPLAAFDPQAIPTVPLPPPVPPRRGQAANAGLRISASRDPADRLVRPETDATVHALLERLERGVVRRNQVAQVRGRVRPDRGLDDALATLRNLARQG